MNHTPPGTGVCVATIRAECRLIIRPSTAGHTAWPMLVADPCPWSLDHDPWEIPHTHAHAHVITTPGPWLRIAPCCRRPYLLTIEAA